MRSKSNSSRMPVTRSKRRWPSFGQMLKFWNWNREKVSGRKQCSLSDAVSDTIEACHSLAAANDKIISEAIEPNIFIWGEERLLRQLVYILVENAVKYSDPCGKIEISLRKLGKKLILEVKNPEKSVKESDLNHLFDRFYRADASRNSKTGGHGIGLSVAKAIADTHGGTIAASKEGEGTIKIEVNLTEKPKG